MHQIIYTKCPLCNSGHFHDYKKIKDHSISKEIFSISECTSCHLLFTNPVPDQEHIIHYYKSETYISHTDKANNIVNLLYKAIRQFTLKRKISLIKKFGGNKLLDIGCGTGKFLEEALKNGFEINGVETDVTARANQSYLIDNQIFNSINAVPKSTKFDLITLWHVLEHIHHLQDQFENISELLKPNGFIFIAVPNPDSWDAHHYQEFWAGWDVPRHLYHFKKSNVKQLLERHNISLIDTLPMKFDSFYVAMLSEKYKGQPFINQLIRGFINGIRSNFKAVNKNYSSIIYIGQKNEH